MKFTPIVLACAGLILLPACEQKSPSASSGNHSTSSSAGTNAPAPGHGGAVIDLGAAVIGPFNVKATRDQGQIVAGKDAPIDVIVTPTEGSSAKVSAVRFWIGAEDAKGSVKAKADIENPAEPNHWHTHAEIPNPIPADAKLWVEIEAESQSKHVGSFGLNM